jgi:hypothetical protein
MSPNKDKMEQEEEYKNAVAVLNELEKLCLGEPLFEKVRVLLRESVCGIQCEFRNIRSDKAD